MGICQDADLPALFPQDGCGLGGGVYPGRARRRRRAAAHAGDGTDHGNGNGRLSGALSSLPGEAHLLAGRLEEAQALAERALALAREHQERGNRRMPCASSARSRRGAIPRRASWPKPTTGRPSPWPRNSACARSRPTATAASARCMPAIGQRSRLAPSCPPPSTLYRAMDMTFWLPQAEAALAQVEEQ